MWKPLIYRRWSTRHGQFVWSHTTPKANSWTRDSLMVARALERKAAEFCRRLNKKEPS